MSAVPANKKRERQPASQAPARHSGAIRSSIADGTRNPAPSSERPAAKVNPRAAASVDSWTGITLGALATGRGKTINPAKTSHQKFELYSVPRFPHGQPETVTGEAIESNKQLVEPKTVLLCKINPRINRAWVVGNFTEFQKIASTEWIAFPPSQEVMPEFLCYFLQQNTVRDFLARNASGVGGSLMRVKPATLRDFPFAYPHLEEQRQIVSEIEKQFILLDAGVTALRRVQANLKRYRAAVLKAACEGRLVPTEAELSRNNSPSPLAGEGRGEGESYETGEQLLTRILAARRKQWEAAEAKSGRKTRRKYKEPAAPDTTNLPSLPEGWAWTRLEQLGVTYGGLTKNPKRAKLPNQLPYLRVANVYANELRLNEVEQIGVADSELEKLLVRAGDLLIVEGNGSKDQIGRLAIWDGSIDPCVHQNHLIKVRLVNPAMSKWILYWLQSLGGRHFVELVASSTSGLYTLSVNKVSDLPVLLPPPAEQARIVAEVERRLSVIEELEVAVTANLQRAARLRQAVLARVFSGERAIQEQEDSSNDVIDLKAERQKRHFARALLSAEIVHRLHGEPTFGRVKHQKIFHLCEHIAQIDEIQGQYHREAAGPLDNKLIYANEAELKKQKWYEEVRRTQYGHAYRPLAKAGNHRKYIERCWSNKLPVVETLIEVMRRWNTGQCEMFSTAYAAWNDLIIWGKEPTEAAIIYEILERWHENKKRFPPDRWHKVIGWMKKEGYVPIGFGQATAEPEQTELPDEP